MCCHPSVLSLYPLASRAQHPQGIGSIPDLDSLGARSKPHHLQQPQMSPPHIANYHVEAKLPLVESG